MKGIRRDLKEFLWDFLDILKAILEILRDSLVFLLDSLGFSIISITTVGDPERSLRIFWDSQRMLSEWIWDLEDPPSMLNDVEGSSKDFQGSLGILGDFEGF